MRYFFYFCCFLLFSQILSAQNKTKTVLSGTVVDSLTQQPIEYATITVLDQSSRAINGTVTNKKGDFEIKNLKKGIYSLSVDFIGYRNQKINAVEISDNKEFLHLDKISLLPSDPALAAVTVTSQKPIVENKIDKIVYNAANDITSQGGIALDVLKKVPQVTVDIDGNVELQGNSSIQFLINGKPSSVFGSSLADALASIPASEIKSIEAITSPGAKYSAQGTGGIINIILKDSKVQGYNGSINLGAGTRLNNASVNLNVRNHNFGMNAFFGGNAQLSSHTPVSQNRLSMDTVNKSNTNLLQDGYSDFTRNGYHTGLGFDWGLTKKDNLSGSFSYHHFSYSNSGLSNQQQITRDNSGSIISEISNFRNSENQTNMHSYDLSLDYKKKFSKEGRELEILFDGSYGLPNSHYTQIQTIKGQTNPYTGSRSNNPGTDRETEISIDYTDPVSDKFLIETGLKTELNTILSEADVYTFNASTNGIFIKDPAQSYSLNYDRKVFAGYFSTTFSVGNWLNIKSGLRLEHTNTKIDFPNTSIPSYNSWVPSVIFSHNFENESSVKLAYSHRIERPDYRDINPFLNFADPYNISTGNPMLQPELGNNFELGYNKTFKNGGTIYISIVSRFNSHDIKPYTSFYPTFKVGDSVYSNVSVSTRFNIGLENRTGLNISGSLPLGKLNLRTDMFMSNRHVVNQLTANSVTNGFDARFNLNVTYQFPHNLVVESFGTFNTAVNNIQGKRPQFFAYTFAFRKFLLDKKVSIGLTATNPFSRYVRQVTTIQTANYTSYDLRLVPFRSFGISLSYKFGKLEFKKSKEEDQSFLNNPPMNGN